MDIDYQTRYIPLTEILIINDIVGYADNSMTMPVLITLTVETTVCVG